MGSDQYIELEPLSVYKELWLVVVATLWTSCQSFCCVCWAAFASQNVCHRPLRPILEISGNICRGKCIVKNGWVVVYKYARLNHFLLSRSVPILAFAKDRTVVRLLYNIISMKNIHTCKWGPLFISPLDWLQKYISCLFCFSLFLISYHQPYVCQSKELRVYIKRL